MNTYSKAIKVRRNRQAQMNRRVKGAMVGLPSHTAKLNFDLTNPTITSVDGNRNARTKAIAMVSELLDTFSLPAKAKLDYLGMIKNATTKDGMILDGVVKVGATIPTVMGHRIAIDIPVVIKDKNLLEPAVFFYDGAPYILSSPAIDQLVKRGSLKREIPDRHMFAPPLFEQWVNLDKAREPIMNRDHMFNPGSRNPWKFRRYSDKEQRERTNIDTPTEFPEIWKGDVAEQILDPAERDREDLFAVGSDVTVNEDIEVRERGGSQLIIPSGEIGKVVRDMKGDGLCILVKFPELELSAVVPKRYLKSASYKEAQTLRGVYILPLPQLPEIAWTLYVDSSGSAVLEYTRKSSADILASSGGDAADIISMAVETNKETTVDSVEKLQDLVDQAGLQFDLQSHYNDILEQVKTDYPDFGGSDIEASGPVTTSKDLGACEECGGVDGKHTITCPLAKMTMKAATIEQVKHEVREMLREGYQPVDIKAAIQSRYPEHAQEALEGLH